MKKHSEFGRDLSGLHEGLSTAPENSVRSMSHRRRMLVLLCTIIASWLGAASIAEARRPNVLIAISDDQSWPHASAYGSSLVKTPAFDQVAGHGVLFNNAFCPAPGCSPSRAAFLTGRHIWQIEEAGTHASYFSKRYEVFPDRLEQAGYFVGYTGKGWGPGNFKKSGRTRNPAGNSFSAKPTVPGDSKYVAAFREFMRQKKEDQQFYFWFGANDAHRSYVKGSGLDKGMTLDQAEVPGFLPDRPEIRSDLLDYAFEVERFDNDLAAMLKIVEEAGELEDTLIIVTSDNGMPFPRAKANCYELGIHMPLAVRWDRQIPAGRTVDDLVSFVDLTATIYEAAEVDPPSDPGLSGRSLMKTLASTKNGIVDESREFILAGRERHSSSRFNSLSYPQRCLRTQQFLYIHNFKPERWPAGPAQKYDKAAYDPSGRLVSSTLGAEHGGYHDIDACPSLTFLINQRRDPEIARFLALAVDRRPADELFDIKKDPACLNNLATDPKFADTLKELKTQLMKSLEETQDARVTGNGDVWESYPRVSGLRWFPTPDWARENPDAVPDQPWVDARRPKPKP